MATISDKLCKVGDGTGVYPNVATSTTTRLVGGKVLACDNLTGWAKDTPVHFSTYRLNADGTVNTSTQTDWKGIVSDNTITQMTRVAGAVDTGNNPGDKVELNPTVGWANDLIAGLLQSLTTTGTIKTGAVGSTQLASKAVTPVKVDWENLFGVRQIDIPAKDPFSVSQSWAETTVGTNISISTTANATYLLLVDATFVDPKSDASEFVIRISDTSSTLASKTAYAPAGLHALTWFLKFTAKSSSVTLSRIFKGLTGSDKRWGAGGALLMRIA